MRIEREELLKFIPHRPPFLFLDRIESLTYSQEIVTELIPDLKLMMGATSIATFQVLDDLEILRGHFPGYPIVPGVVQVEMMAQCSCFHVYGLLNAPDLVKLNVALLGVESAKFRKPLLPGMTATITATCLKFRSGMVSTEGKIEVDGKLLSESQFMASVSITPRS